jgi:NAD(P)H dehydrogenase (quinone)
VQHLVKHPEESFPEDLLGGRDDRGYRNLRPAWFLENIAWDLASARNDGFIQSYLQPLDRAIPMVGIYDIGRLAADLIVEQWAGHRVVELEGNARISPLDLGRMLTILLGRDVEVRAVPCASWESLFRESGMQNPYPRIRMLDGFNEGWIDFEGGHGKLRKGHIAAEEVLRELIEKTAA